MKNSFAIALLSIIATLPVCAQSWVYDGVSASGYSTPASASSAVTDGHDCIIPVSLRSNPLGHSIADSAAYVLLHQPTSAEDGSCATSNETTAPIQTVNTGLCINTLREYEVLNFANATAAKIAYDALDSMHKPTAYLLATPATNAPYVVLVQTTVHVCQ